MMDWGKHHLIKEADVVRPLGWQGYAWLGAGFTLRSAGNMHYGFGEADTVRAARQQVSGRLGFELDDWVCTRQVHQTRIQTVGTADRGRGALAAADGLAETDGLVTAGKSVLLAVFVADCVPILMIDPGRTLVGAFHAGWRGTIAGKAGAAVQAMRSIGSDPADLEVVIGPSIGPCCYEVDEQVIEPAGRFLSADGVGVKLAERLKQTRRFDLWAANEWALRRAGVQKIIRTDLCTACHTDLFFSNRAEGGIKGEFAGLIGIKRAFPVKHSLEWLDD